MPFTTTRGVGSARGYGLTAAAAGGGLYEFTSNTFTNGDGDFEIPPSLASLRGEYPSWSDSFLNMPSPGIQNWTVPADGVYRITATGAGGGTSEDSTGGLGAIVRGDFSLSSGQIISILVGQRGSNQAIRSATTWCGGGGGTFVWDANLIPFGGQPSNDPMLAAGGGGGASDDFPKGQDATLSTSGTNNASNSASGGSGGNGGSIPSGTDYPATAGAGWYSNGAGGNVNCTFNYIESTFPNDGGDAGRGGGNAETTLWGGFGGGGGGSQRCGSAGGGGGGGYSGGAGGDDASSGAGDSGGGGGGSFISASASNRTFVGLQGSYDLNGTVFIEFLG